MTAPAADTRFCEQCLSVKPLTEFRQRSPTVSARMNQCRSCHNQAERERRASNRAQRDHRRMGKVLSAISNQRSNAQLELLTTVIFQHFGGMQGFVAAWGDYRRRAVAQGGFAALRCFKFIIRLLRYCEDKEPDLGQMTDEELTRSAKHLIQQIQNSP